MLFVGSRNSPTENRNTSSIAGIVPATVTGEALKLAAVNRQGTITIEFPDSSPELSDIAVTVTCKFLL